MIEREVLDIVTDPTDDGQRLNRIADQFRDGRDVNEVVALLDSSNPELVSIGAWILGELSFDLYDKETLLSRLRELTDHADPGIRFSALGALFPALDPTQASTKMLLHKLLRDPNQGVRERAEAAAARLFHDIEAHRRELPWSSTAPRPTATGMRSHSERSATSHQCATFAAPIR